VFRLVILETQSVTQRLRSVDTLDDALTEGWTGFNHERDTCLACRTTFAIVVFAQRRSKVIDDTVLRAAGKTGPSTPSFAKQWAAILEAE
jgi:hypothetical protein